MNEKYFRIDMIEELKRNHPIKRKVFFDFFCRSIDVLLSTLLILATLPLTIGIAAAIKLSDYGPIFFTQDRTGKNGVPFKLLKFRSMVKNADQIGPKLRSYTDDPRFTRTGKFLREYHLDELPQLLNVLKGDMSLVGPRPALTFQIDYYENWELVRAAIRPGLTGLSQVSGGNMLSWDERIIIDVYYCRNRDLALYFSVIGKTIKQLFHKKGVHGKNNIVKGWTRGLPQSYFDDTMQTEQIDTN